MMVFFHWGKWWFILIYHVIFRAFTNGRNHPNVESPSHQVTCSWLGCVGAHDFGKLHICLGEKPMEQGWTTSIDNGKSEEVCNCLEILQDLHGPWACEVQMMHFWMHERLCAKSLQRGEVTIFWVTGPSPAFKVGIWFVLPMAGLYM